VRRALGKRLGPFIGALPRPEETIGQGGVRSESWGAGSLSPAGGAGGTRRGTVGTRHARARAPRRLGARAASACTPLGTRQGRRPGPRRCGQQGRHAAHAGARSGAQTRWRGDFHLTLFD
jgi:hypothetical protein